MAAWDTGVVTREEAGRLIRERAENEGIRGAFKVYYDGAMIANPSDLPEQVDMAKVRVSAALDNA